MSECLVIATVCACNPHRVDSVYNGCIYILSAKGTYRAQDFPLTHRGRGARVILRQAEPGTSMYICTHNTHAVCRVTNVTPR